MFGPRIFLVALFASGLWAQTFRGSLTGTVTDTSGAAIPVCSVRLDNTATGFTRTVLTSGAGEYNFPDLAPGIYTVTITHAGLESRRVDKIEIEVSKTTNINVQLGVAQQQQLVEVSAAAVNLEATSSDLAAVVNDKTVQELPMNGRDFKQMIKLAPGVTSNGSDVNGMRSTSNNYQVDGADNNDAMNGTEAQNQGGVSGIAGGLLPIDAIDQFSVQTNAGSDMGRNSGSNINMVIKSGTNTIHGTVYFFNRNEDLASPSPLLPHGSRPQEIRNNQPGFSIGGPIIKNKTFFFLSGEIQLAIAGESILDTSPSAAWVAAGDAVLSKYGVPVNPVSTNLLTIFPAYSRTGPATANNYLANALDTYNSFNGLAKIDHRFSDKHSLSVRYFGSAGTQIADVGSHFKDFFQTAPMHIVNFSVVENAILSARLVNQLTLGANYFMQTFQDDNIGFSSLALGLNTGSNIAGAPTLKISGFDYVGATQPSGRTDTTGHITDNLSYTAGRHQIKVGGEFRRTVLDVGYFSNVRGTFSFDGTRGPWSSDPTDSSTLKAMADFLAGYPSNASGATITRGLPEPIWLINAGYGWIHDNFQVSPQLNINFGLRYDYLGVWHDSKDNLANFVPGVGFTTAQLYPKQPLDFAPRLGFSYAPKWTKRLVIRGGYGLFYDTPPGTSFASVGASNGAASGVAYNPGGPNPVYALSATNVVLEPGVPVFGNTTATPPFGASSISQGFKMPYAQNYNLNIQTQLSKTTLLQVGYVGNVGVHLLTLLDINQPVNGVRPYAQEYPTLAAINQLNTNANSRYNSMQNSLRQQLSHGFTANLNYTWSHAIDDDSSTTTPMDSYNLSLDKGASTFDARQILTGFITYEVPQYGRFAPRLTKGWQLNALLTFSTGSPVNITTGKNTDLTGENKDRVNLVGNPYANVPVLTGTQAVQYFNPAAFAAPASGTYGDLGRDIIYGPGFGSVDFSIFKRTPITERIMTELRVEILNVFNQTNWASPTATLSSASFGELTQTKNGQSAPGLGFGEPRNVQLALKLIF
jgi:hypothetical protein